MKQLSGRRFVLLTDENISAHCLPILSEFFADSSPMDMIEVEAGEGAKSPEVAMQLWAHLMDLGFTKSDVVVCLGGGSILDLGGFVASTFKRGVPALFLPTTLLAMTDAALGGKNGVDIGEVKNLVGTIVQPEAIIVYPPFCETLPPQELKSGAAEVLKHAIIGGGELWSRLEVLEVFSGYAELDILKLSVRVKMKIVAQDEREAGLRKILNFGHTIGHAVESQAWHSGRPIQHGIAVAFGMYVESVLAFSLGMLNQEDFGKITNRIAVLYGADFTDLPKWSDTAKFIVHDKKWGQAGISLYLPLSIGGFRPQIISESSSLEEAYNQSLRYFTT
ncbi:MAG: 3-dehydroquinate synthase family protein [Flavobacteriales bacterium]